MQAVREECLTCQNVSNDETTCRSRHNKGLNPTWERCPFYEKMRFKRSNQQKKERKMLEEQIPTPENPGEASATDVVSAALNGQIVLNIDINGISTAAGEELKNRIYQGVRLGFKDAVLSDIVPALQDQGIL